MNNTALIVYKEGIKQGIIFRKLEYLKVLLDIFFCLVRIYKFITFDNQIKNNEKNT